MNRSILSSEVQEYIGVNLQKDVNVLLLKRPVFEGVTNKELAEQIISKRKSKTKLPTWFDTDRIYYPTKISIEQTSSEKAAQYKTDLISGKTLVDLTGGFGVDDFYFSQVFDSVTHCEINQELSIIVEYNFEKLGVRNCQFIAEDGIKFLKETDKHFDWIYIDPSRRDEVKGKVFLMKDCLPDVPSNLDLLFSKSDNILMKTSPLVDISKGLTELEFVKEIHVVAVKNEVRELLWMIEKDFKDDLKIKTINLLDNANQLFEYNSSQEGEIDCDFSMPKKYIYEPNAAIMKSGGFNQIGIKYELKKLDKHSHLYTSNKLISFPGRRFVVKEVISKGKEIKTKLQGRRANVTTRNYPQKVEEIRKSLKIKDGGEEYLFFTTNMKGEKICLVCTKV